jgi:PBSX family phage terminase large subunit
MATTDTQQGPLQPYGEQRRFLGTDDRYYAFISGIGAGKTVAGIIRTILNVSEWNVGNTGYIIAPTVPSLRNVIIPELEKWGIIDRCEFNRSEKRLEFPNGSRVILESADNDRKIERLRGPSIAWFWMDEAATIDTAAWDVMVGRLRDGDYLNAFVTTTPKGYNWVYESFVDEDKRLDDVTAITGVPTHENPHLPDEYTDDVVEEYEGVFYEQEVLGAFRQAEGLVYPWFDGDNVVDEPPETYAETIYGVDWGYNSPSVILAIVREGDRWMVVDEFYERHCTVDDLATHATALQEQWGAGTLYCDAAEPASIEAFQRAGLDARAAEKDVLPGIQHVAAQGDDLAVVATCQNTRNEFSQYQWQDDDDQDKPVKQNDHAMDALRYALFSHETTTTVRRRSGTSPTKGTFR